MKRLTHKSHKRSHTPAATIILALTLCSGLALADPDKDASKKDILRGPDISAPANDHLTNNQAPSDRKDQIMAGQANHDDRPIMLREYLSAIKHAQRGKLADELALTETQRSQIKNIIAKHRQAMQAFQKEHADEINDLKAKMKAAAKERNANRQGLDRADRSKGKDNKNNSKAHNGDRPARPDHPGRDRLRELIDNAPANKAALSELKQVLSPGQFDLLTKQIHEFRAKRASGQGRGAGPRPAQRGFNKDNAKRDNREHTKRSKPTSSGDD